MANPYGVPSGLGPTGSNPYESSDMYGNPSGGNFYNTTPNTGSPSTPHSHGLGAWAPVAGAAVGGILGGLMGGGSDHGMGQYSGNQNTDASNIDSLANQQRGRGGTQFGYMDSDQAQQRASAEKLRQFYQNDPNTANQRAADMANMTGGTTQNYLHAIALLKQQSAALNGGAAGVGSAASSGTQGGVNYLTGGLANKLADAQSNEFNNVQADRERRAKALFGLDTDMTNQDFGLGNKFYGDAANNYQQSFQDWQTMYQNAAAQAQAEAAQNNAQIQGIGSAIGGAFAGGF